MGRLCTFVGGLALALILSPAAWGCDQAPRPAIHISLAEKPVKFDLTRTVADLSRIPVDTASPYPSHYHTEVGGVMDGEIALEHKITFNTKTAGGKTCVVLKEIDIELSIKPTIYIASNFQKQACWFKQIFAHESKHVEVDRAIMRKYGARISDGLNMMLMEPADYVSGWVGAAESETAQYDMQAGIENALAVLFNRMMRERNGRQQEIDSLEEYQRIGNACQVSS